MNPDKREKPDNLIKPLEDRHKDYLKDESRTSGKAESISFPESETQIQVIVKTLLEQKTPITVQGSRTGIVGGAVPVCGHILNLSKMTRVTGLELDQDGEFSIRVQPGISLSDLDQQLYSGRFDCDGWDKNALAALEVFKKSERLVWPPDPSERSASIGGIAANNSRGICALYYGAARLHIKSIRLVDANGEIHSITRGQYIFSQGVCPLPGGDQLRLDLATLQSQSSENLMDGNDLLDLYLGSEGMLGVITELTLFLQPLPKELWGIVFFFEDQSRAVNFIQGIDPKKNRQKRQKQKRQKTEPDTDIVAIEFMDQTTLECIREYKQGNSQLKQLPDWDKSLTSAVYMEIHGNIAEEVEALSERLLGTAVQCDCDPDNTWAFCGEMEIERLRIFRHAAAESVNLFIDKARQKDSRITKLGTDYRLKNGSLSEVLDMYCRDLQTHGLKAAIFGHAADGHLHVNILPQDYQQFEKGRALIKDWAIKIYAKEGSVVTEHGVGKIKKDLFGSIALPQRVKMIRSVKQQLDPNGLWNPGNMLDLD
ncbi:MAG: FAD-binding oxidoreductase [Desulfobacula sp.]|jgi:D-lactate dehydrogenase (cytochrome)|nr:FAD-binding oxidoreductase [Desulfobacula sp.]